MSAGSQVAPAPPAAPGRKGRGSLRDHLVLVEAGAAVLAIAALAVSRGEYGPIALALITAALALSLTTALAGRRGPAPPGGGVAPVRLLGGAAVLSCLWHVALPPGSHLDPPQPLAFRVPAALAAVVCATWLLPSVPRWLARSRFWIAAACFAAMAVAVILYSPLPFIDVWWIQQLGARALLHGVDPYAITYPNYYGHTLWYAPELIENGRIAFYPYPPLTLGLGALAFAVAGDVRWALALLVLLAGWLVRRAGRGSTLAETAALALLFQPVSFLIVEKAWTEPAMLAGAGLTACAMLRRERDGGSASWTAVAAGLLCASKQYAPLVAIPLAFALPPRRRAAVVALAAAIAVATVLPFAIWDPAELWRDLVEAQVLQPFRMDALSWLVAAARAVGRPLPSAIGILAVGAVLLATVRPRAAVDQALRAASAGLLALFAFNKQAFANYYWLAAGLLLLAAVVTAERARAAAPAPGDGAGAGS